MIIETVSVIITTYKATFRLAQAIESVLTQTYKSLELIVVDDNNPGSEARLYTQSVMEKYKNHPEIHYIQHEKNKNGAAARNTGIMTSIGSYIAFLDDDDYFYPERLEKCVNVMQNSSDCIAVYSSVDLYQKDQFVGVREATSEGYIWKELLLNEGLLGTGSNLFVRRSAVEAIGGFDERFLRYQDVEFMLRICEKGRVAVISEVLVRKNLEPTNLPAYKKYYENKQLIFSKFSYLIEKLDNHEKERFYSIHYETLFLSALESCDRRIIRQALGNLRSVKRNLSIKYYIKAVFPRLYKFYSRVK